MLIWFIVIYLLLSTGLYAAIRGRYTKDYAIAADFFGSLFVSDMPRV